MGFEYRILTALPSIEAGEQILENVFGECGRKLPNGWEYRAPTTKGPMPDVVAKVESHGFYLCIFSSRNGLGAQVAGEIILLALSFGEVKVQEME